MAMFDAVAAFAYWNRAERWGGSDHPAGAYLDLGQIYDLTDVYLRDIISKDRAGKK